jgi:acyl-CoA thioesterase FadM
MQFLASFGFAELDLAGVGLIMADAGIEFKNEAFYGDVILASVAAVQVSKLSFDLYYKLETETEGKKTIIATAKTGMVCFDYSRKKIVTLPEKALIIFKEKPE